MEHNDSMVEVGTAGDNGAAQELRQLRTLLHITLVALIVVSGSITVVLLQQTKPVRRQIAQMSLFASQYEKSEIKQIEGFFVKMDEFAKSHPDFRPTVAKYYRPEARSQAGLPAAVPAVQSATPPPVVPRK